MVAAVLTSQRNFSSSGFVLSIVTSVPPGFNGYSGYAVATVTTVTVGTVAPVTAVRS